jgi:hypothetical protein
LHSGKEEECSGKNILKKLTRTGFFLDQKVTLKSECPDIVDQAILAVFDKHPFSSLQNSIGFVVKHLH